MKLLNEGILPNTTDAEENKKAKKRTINYHWHDQNIYSKGLFVPKLEERKALVIQMHTNVWHSGKQWTLVEIYKRYVWHNRMEDVKTIARMCQ
jgi:hypothetical protein